jgi:putative cardiolipin synthase
MLPLPPHRVSSRRTPCHGRLALLAFVIAAGVAGCAGLPKDVQRPVSTAYGAPHTTGLGQLVDGRRVAAGGRHPSGFMLLSGAQTAYSSRLALVNAAQKSLDLQYYAIHADASTERLLLGVVEAAQRGVRVRVLLDDFHSTGRDAQVMRMAFVPNIEMRMFNPLTGARGSTLGRMLSAATDFSRVQQRMHNKLFIADNAMGITGGRNLGDAYFGNADSGNFVDLDVLAAGPIVKELSRSFDSYWNNERAYPVQSLVSREELDAMRARAQASDDAARERESPIAPSLPVDGPRPFATGAEPPASPEQLARVWNRQPMDLAHAEFVWAPAAVLVDKPAKIPSDGTASPTLPEKPPSKATPLAVASRGAVGSPSHAARQSTPRAAALNHAASRAAIPSASAALADQPVPSPSPDNFAQSAQGDTVVDGLLHLIGQAQRDLLIISPYFVPGPDMKQAFAEARARGVRVRILTNSLASNDAPIAHAGYARHRPDLLAMGVELYEMRSDTAGLLKGALGSTGSSGGGLTADAPGSGAVGSSRAMLHSKLLIVDGRLLAAGSMNLDMRSQLQNTEIALLIRSRALSHAATAPIETALREAAWHVQLKEGSDLVWRAPEGSGLADTTTEPDASVPLRLMLKLLGPFAPDHLL